MVSLDLKSATISKLGPLIRDRQVSPVDMIQATLQRIEALNSIWEISE